MAYHMSFEFTNFSEYWHCTFAVSRRPTGREAALCEHAQTATAKMQCQTSAPYA